LQANFQVSDDEWAVLEPRISQVQKLIRERERLTHLRPPPPPKPDQPDAVDPNRNQLVVETPPDLQRNPPTGTANIKLAEVFRRMATAASSSNTSAAELKQWLESYRAARAQSEKEIAEARTQLRELLTPRQEVILVLAGILD
jgi:hypothetical protein